MLPADVVSIAVQDLSAAKRAVLDARLRGMNREMPIEHRERRGPIPSSFGQQRLWFIERVSRTAGAYTVSVALRLDGVLDRSALERALGEIVRRHGALRTTFAEVDGVPMQVVRPFDGFVLAEEDVSTLDPADRELALQRRAAENATCAFDLATGPLCRATLLRLGQEDHALLLALHHIVSDEWSLRIFFRELSALYGAYRRGCESRLAEPALQYADYAVWQREHLQGESLDRHVAYWKAQLAGAPALLPLPTDHARPAVQTFRGAQEPLELSRDLLERLRALALAEQATLFMVLLAAVQVLLGKYAGSDDVVVGSPIAGRTRRELEGTIGFFVNMLVLRGDLSGDPSFREVVRRMRSVTLGAYEHQDVPFDRLVAELQPERTPSYSPLFQVALMLHEEGGAALHLPGLQVRSVPAPRRAEKYDLALSLAATPDGVRGTLSYSADLFERETIARMCVHCQQLLEQLAHDADCRLSALTLLDAGERAQVVRAWNETDVDVGTAVVHRQFELQTARTPDAVAVVCRDMCLTYAELDARANRLAHHLRRLGVTPEVPVALCLQPRLDVVVALLGVLKAGGVYVPLDPSYPAERLAFMLADAGVHVVLTDEALRGTLPVRPGLSVVSVDGSAAAIAGESAEPLVSGADPQSLAYVIYTSGSTGVPKGVAVQHRGVVRLVRGANYLTLGLDTVMLQAAPLSFDASTLEIWGPLLNGGRLVLVAASTPSLADVCAAIVRHGVTTLWLGAGLFHVMVEQRLEDLCGLQQLLAGGDVLSVDAVNQVRRRFPALRLINGYGPTENTTFTCCYTVSAEWRDGAVPIGAPISNTRVFVLDPALQPLPVGLAGELHAGGLGLARGYLDRPGLTADRFIPDPFGPAGARLYRTGDRVRWRADGTLAFLGRFDRQVKIRGFRVEPGEVNAVLTAHPGVREAHVLVREDVPGEKRVVAYVTGRVSSDELREYVRRTLPEYMVPAAFVVMPEFPVTANGKLDSAALPPPEYGNREQVAPSDFVEVELIRIWEELLGVEVMDPTLSFFELGGHSLLAMRLLAEIDRRLHYHVPLAAFFRGATVRQMADAIRSALPSTAPSSVMPLQSGGSLPTLWLVHTANGKVMCYVNLVRHLGSERPIWGIQDLSRDLSRPVHEIAAEHVHALRSVRPEGPYCLAGWSFGGLVAYEMASLLERQGETVSFLGLLDTVHPAIVRGFTSDDLDILIDVGHELAVLARRPFSIGRAELESLEPDERFHRMVSALRTQGISARIDTETLRQYVDGTRERAASARAFAPRTFSGPITLFRASGNRWAPHLAQRTPEEQRTLGWSRLAPIVNVQDIPGTHDTLVREPHVRALAQRLRESLAALHR